MTDKKITDLTAATTITGDELVPLVQSGTTLKAAVSLLRLYPNAIDVPPASPDAWNDEFNDPTLSGWSFVNQASNGATCHATVENHQLILQDDAAASTTGNGRLFIKPKPAGAFNLVTKVRFDSFFQYHNCGIALYNSSTGAYYINRLVNRTNNQHLVTPGYLFGNDVSTMNGSENNGGAEDPEIYLRIQRPSADTVIMSYSKFGRLWVQLYNGTITDASYDSAGLYFCNFLTSGSILAASSFDWIRNLV